MHRQGSPYMLIEPEKASLVDNEPLPTSVNLNQVYSPVYSVPVQRILFAYRIPYLRSEFDLSQRAGPAEQVAQALERTRRLIASLGESQGIALALRYYGNPTLGEIQISLVARFITPDLHEGQTHQRVSGYVSSLFSSFGYPVEPVTSRTELEAILDPIPDPFILEIRQHEDLAHMKVGDAYVVYPFRPPTTTWSSTCAMMLEQSSPVLISVYLEPTKLLDYERESFSQAREIASALCSFRYSGFSYEGRITDSVALVVARLYNYYLQRFIKPFLLSVQVVSSDTSAAGSIAQVLASDLTDTLLPGACDIVAPQTADEQTLARRTLTFLELRPWGASLVTPGKERLRYLMGADGASCAFRFPVSVLVGVPGIDVRQAAPRDSTDMFASKAREIEPISEERKEAGSEMSRAAPLQKMQKVSRPIKILCLAANPSDTARLRLDKEARAIDEALRLSEFREGFDIKQHWAVRVADLEGCLLRHKPDIVHFSGHGSKSSEIILEDSSGNRHPVSVRALSRLFSVLKDNIRCVVLNTCYSEQQAVAIAGSIDCVIGMSKGVGDSAAISFAAAFYQALGFGRDVKTAFDLGCIQVDLESLDEQDVPKLLAVRRDPKEIVFVGNG